MRDPQTAVSGSPGGPVHVGVAHARPANRGVEMIRAGSACGAPTIPHCRKWRVSRPLQGQAPQEGILRHLHLQLADHRIEVKKDAAREQENHSHRLG